MSERIVLALDTSSEERAEKLIEMAASAGGQFVKLGLELASATSWRYCSRLAAAHGLDWVADSKLDDIPNTVVATVENLSNLDHPPVAITIHTSVGLEAMRQAQARAETIKMLGVTVLTSISAAESEAIYGRRPSEAVMILAEMAVDAGLKGIVASPKEVATIKQNQKTETLFAMIPGVRSATAGVQDQVRVSTPAATIKAGADLIVIGRQVTQAKDPRQAYKDVSAEVRSALDD